MKIGNLVAGVVRKTVKGVASTGASELKKAGKSMVGQVVSGKQTSSDDSAPQNVPRIYNNFSAIGETKKFGLNLMSQVSGKRFSYQELQELQAASGGKGSTAHDQLRAKIDKVYQRHDQLRKQQEQAAKQKQQETEVKAEVCDRGAAVVDEPPQIGVRLEVGVLRRHGFVKRQKKFRKVVEEKSRQPGHADAAGNAEAPVT